jgi:hypothetical protein
MPQTQAASPFSSRLSTELPQLSRQTGKAGEGWVILARALNPRLTVEGCTHLCARPIGVQQRHLGHDSSTVFRWRPQSLEAKVLRTWALRMGQLNWRVRFLTPSLSHSGSLETYMHRDGSHSLSLRFKQSGSGRLPAIFFFTHSL